MFEGWDNFDNRDCDGYYLHPINKTIETIRLKDAWAAYKIHKQTGKLLTLMGLYLSEPIPLTYSLHPIFISEEKLKKYYNL